MNAPEGLRPRRGVSEIEGGWRLAIPAGGAGGPRDLAGAYRLAELEDYLHLPRRRFPHCPPLRLSLRARASAPNLPGTWGFGWWNDPFSLSLGLGGGVRRIPALPNAAWFFFASQHNYLSFRDHLPASGALAATFRAAPLPGWALAPAALALPLLALRPLARLARRLAARLIKEDAAALAHDPTEWHAYEIEWRENAVSFRLDGETVLQTPVAPRPPLGLVLWLDNQYAAWRPDGRLSYGFLANDPAWIEIRDLTLEPLPA
jgi:hypothetical protein